MSNFEIRKYENNVSGIYFPKKDIEFLIDSEDEKLLEGINWGCKKNNTITGIYYSTKDKKHIYLHRIIMKAKEGEKVHFISKNSLDLRKSNMFLSNGPKPQIQTGQNTNSNHWEIVKVISKEPYFLLCNNLTNTFEKLDGTLTSNDLKRINLAFNN